jgi:fucose 4-O-acetylase-like acetyltransferase
MQFNLILKIFETNPFFDLIYSFHMPLFMFISGYIAYFTIRVNNYKDSAVIITKKFKNLAIPFLSWYFIVEYLVRKTYKMQSFNDFALHLIRNPSFGLWFFWVLFLCFVVLVTFLYIRLFIFSIKHWVFDVLFWCFIAVFLMITPISIFGVQMLKWYFPFFITGFLFSKYKVYIGKHLNIVGQFSMLIFPILLSQYSYMDNLEFINYLEGFSGIVIEAIDKLYRFLIAFVGIVVVFIIVKEIIKIKQFEKLAWLGQYTMEIYAIHFYFVKIVGTNYVSGELGESIIIATQATIIALTSSLLISFFFIRKSKILSFLLLGK